MERLVGTMCWSLPDAQTKCNWENVVGPFVFHLDEMYSLSELRDGSFDVYKDGTALSETDLLRRREGTKLWYLFLRLLSELRNNRSADAAQEQGGDDDGDQGNIAGESVEENGDAGSDADEPPPQQQQAPNQNNVKTVRSVFVVPVCNGRDRAVELLQRNAANAEIVDYSEVVSFAWYIALNKPAHAAVLASLRKILEENQERLGTLGQTDGTGKAPKPAEKGKRLVRKVDERWVHSVEAVNGSAMETDMRDACLFHHARGSKPTQDWSFTIRDEGDFVEMVNTVYARRAVTPPAGQVATLSDLASLLAGHANLSPFENGNITSARPDFFRLSQTAALPLRGTEESVRFGRGAAIAAIMIPPRAMTMRTKTRSKATRFMLLRDPSKDLKLFEAERSTFNFIVKNPVIAEGNIEGGLTRFKVRGQALFDWSSVWELIIVTCGTLLVCIRRSTRRSITARPSGTSRSCVTCAGTSSLSVGATTRWSPPSRRCTTGWKRTASGSCAGSTTLPTGPSAPSRRTPTRGSACWRPRSCTPRTPTATGWPWGP